MSCNFFSDSTGLYFYSAVFQGNMALLAIVGVVVVFRLQQIASSLSNTEAAVYRRLEYFVSMTYLTYRHEIFNEPLENHRAKLNEIKTKFEPNRQEHNTANILLNNSELTRLYDTYSKLSTMCEEVKNAIKAPVRSGSLVLLGSLILLPLANSINRLQVWPIEAGLFALMILLNLRFLKCMWRFSQEWL